jgi:hypothetical protein
MGYFNSILGYESRNKAVELLDLVKEEREAILPSIAAGSTIW